MTKWKTVSITSALLACLFLIFIAHLLSKHPTQNADWKTSNAVLPQVTLQGDRISIKNFRDFRYADDGSISEARYRDVNFRLSQLKSVWLGLSHFESWGLAHAMVSFEFPQEQYLVVSIEARLTEEQDSYGPVSGLFRNYTKMMVLGSEQDIIGLRSHTRKEALFLYQLQGSELQAKALLLNFLRQAQSLASQPEFYNTLTDNCLTGLLMESKQYRDAWRWLDYRILLPGYADRLLLQDGVILDRGGIEATRAYGKVNPADTELDAKHFSRAIRTASTTKP